MYWILFVMAAIVALVIAMLVGGLVTPRAHAVARSMRLRAAPALVWRTVRDLGAYGQWRDDIDDATLVDTEQPQVRWRETNSRGSVTFGIVREETPAMFSARILDEDLPFSGEWTWQVLADGDGTRVTITERGEVSNLLFRFIGAHFIGYTRSIDRYLRSLAHRVGDGGATITDVTPA